MAQAQQVPSTPGSNGDPNNSWSCIDNSAASPTTTLNANAPIGFDTPAVGAPGNNAQATNPFGDTGSTTLDVTNDQATPDPQVATYKGSPVSAVQPTYSKVSTAVQSGYQGIFVKFKNPA